MTHRTMVAVAGMALMAVAAIEVGEAWARAGSGGSRGSRSFSAPAAPRPAAPTPAAPRRPQDASPSPASPMAQRPGMFGGLMGGLGGLLVGGLIGSMLFGGLGGGLGGGIGLLEIALLAGGAWLLYSMFRRRAASAPQPAYAGAGGSAYGQAPGVDVAAGGGGTVAVEVPAATADLERGLGHVRQMDRDFSPATVEEEARDTFRVVQAALTLGDLSVVAERLTPEMRASLQSQSDQLRAARRTNRTGQVEFRRVEVSEAWQESGQDFVTVYLAGSMLDSTVDDATGAVVQGSSTEPVSFEEWWTFTRPVGPNRWRLTAIQAG